MRRLLVFTGMATITVLAAIVSIRLSTDALSILVGALLGMIAILPTIAMVGYLLKKNQEAMAATVQNKQQAQPPVVVVSGGMMPPQYFQPAQPSAPQPSQPMLPPPTQSTPRKFRLMGYEDVDQVEISDEEWVTAG